MRGLQGQCGLGEDGAWDGGGCCLGVAGVWGWEVQVVGWVRQGRLSCTGTGGGGTLSKHCWCWVLPMVEELQFWSFLGNSRR